MHFFKQLQRLTTEELKTLSGLCAGMAVLVGITLVLSGSALLPNWLRLSFLNTSQVAAVYSAAGTYSYVVPAGQTTLFVDLWGGGGTVGTSPLVGSCNGYIVATTPGGSGGGGGFTYAKIPVTPGETLTIVVGAANGGGGGGAYAGTGGGYSGIFRGAVSQANALVVAGGGGAPGNYVFITGPGCGYPQGYWAAGALPGGLGGGNSGGNTSGAVGGSQSAGGTGSLPGGALTGGGVSSGYGGGGGAGYWGGGGGASAGAFHGWGGGGGSGYCAPANLICSMLSPTTVGVAPYSQYAPGGAGNSGLPGAVVIVTGSAELTATPSSIASGNTSQLSWTTSNISPNSCTIRDQAGNLVGAQGLGTDYSGAGNLWTLNNIADTEQLIDAPTNNFATLNPIYFYSPTFAKGIVQGGGLKPNTNYGYAAGWQLNSGKWYWETLVGGGQSSYPLLGVWGDPTSAVTQRAFPGYIYDTGVAYGSDGLLRVLGLTTLANAASLPTFGNDDIIGTAYDADTGKVYFSKNGTWLNSANPASGTGYVYIVRNGTPGGSSYYGKSQLNFGQGGLVPSGLGQGALSTMAYYWNFNSDKISGNTAIDSAGGNTGVWPNGFVSGAGKYGEALTLNGINQDMYTSTQVTNPQIFTLSVWFKTTVASGHKLIGLESDQTGTESFNYDRMLYMGQDGYIHFGIYNPIQSQPVEIFSSNPLNNGAWHHAVATFESPYMRLYIDGAQVASQIMNDETQSYSGYWRVGGYKLGFSSWNSGSDGYFNGSLDDVRVYNSALSASDISTLYTQGPPTTSLTLTYNASAGGKFAYTPPTGFKALSTANLPTPITSNPSQYFELVGHTSTGSGNITINSLLFAPDFAWIKGRTLASSNTFWDRVRGNTLALFTDQSTAQTSLGQLTSLDSNGATLGYGAGQVNYQTNSYMDYFFKEGATPGFDIVTWVGDGTALRSIAHSLGSTPDLIIAKRLDAAGNWYVGGEALGGGKYALLNSNGTASVTNSPFGVDLIPTMTAATTNGVTMSASTEYTGQPAWKAGDKTLGANYWYSYPNTPSVSVPQWLKVDIGTAKTVGSYSITTYYNEVYYLPLNFTFQGSNDNSNWTTLDTQTNVTWAGYSNFRTFTVATPGSYRYYRVNITKADRSVIIAELNLWQSPVPGTTSFTVAPNATNNLNASGASYVAYLFSNREGYLKTGTYLSNGSADGPFIYTGFKPKFLFAKNIDGTSTYSNWPVVDSVRNPYNPARIDLQANSTAAEITNCNGIANGCVIDILTNGFKVRNNNWEWNWSYPQRFLYLAVADAPFKSQYTPNNYSIPNSLRFDGSNSAFLSRTPATAASSTQKQTLSTWVKRGTTGGSIPLFVAVGGSSIDQVRFDSSDTITVFLGSTYTLTTVPVYRDPSAWMHLVITIDTTQGSPNSVKLYINGVQQTLTGSYPPVGYALLNWNKAGIQHYIGRNSSLAGLEFDGMLADVYFVDGLALAPTSFGAYDSNGDWKPTAYTGAVGNNGSHFDFSNTGFTNFSTASGNVTVGPLYQTVTYTMSCISSGENAPVIDTATVTVGGTTPALSLSANPTATTSVGTSTLTWTSLNVNANSCSVTELTPANTVSAFSSMGAGDNTSKITSVLSQAGTYTYKLACAAPYTSGLYNGTLSGAPGTGVAGKYAEAANFAASADYLSIPPISLASGVWTIAAWFKAPLPSTSSGYKTLTRGTSDHQILFSPTGVLGTYNNGGSTFVGTTYNASSLTTGWHHVAAVGSGSATTFYIDGASVGSAAFKSVSNIVAVGNYQGGTQQFGTVDDVRVYNRVLASDEISTLYNGGHITTGLVGYWPFDTASISGVSAYDLALSVASTTATVTVTSADLCTDIAGNQTTVPTGCQTPNPSPGACIPPGKTWNGSQCVAVALPSGISLTSNRVRKGENATLNWTVTGMSSGISCNLAPTLPLGMPAWDNLDPWNGSGTTGAITAPTLYTLTCGNGVASTSAATTVGLLPLYQEI